MDYPTRNNIPYEEIENGALILLLLRESKTWEELCRRYAYADPEQSQTNTNTMSLLKKLTEMRDLGLLSFEDQETAHGRKPIGEIKTTDLWSRIRVAFGGMSLSEAAMLSRHSNGMAVAPVFGRPNKPEEKIDVFVLMPFKAKMEKVYTSHIKKIGEDLGVTIRRADEIYSPRPFMEKVWEGICAAQLILADCTEKNPNVFYEVGIAHTVGKKVVLITRSEKDIPSDIKHFDYIPYIYDPEGVESLVEKLKTVLKSHLKPLIVSAALPEFTMIRLPPHDQPQDSKSWYEIGEDKFHRNCELAADPVFDITVKYESSSTLAVYRVGIRLLQRIPGDGGMLGSPPDVEVHAELEVDCPQKWKQTWGPIDETASTEFVNPKQMGKDNPRLRLTLRLRNFCDKDNASSCEVKFYLVTENGTVESRSIWLSQ